MSGFWLQDLGFPSYNQGDSWEKVHQIKDKFEYDRERRMKDKGIFSLAERFLYFVNYHFVFYFMLSFLKA